MITIDFEGAREYVQQRLNRELSPDMYYHSIFHTFGDVLASVERLASKTGLDQETTLLLRTAAIYHDIGHVINSVSHEEHSARIARETLPQFGYSPQQIERIVGMIMATHLPQTPHNIAEQIMADADLDVLGREDFWERHDALRAEMAAYGKDLPDTAWYESQINFLEAHRYFTEAARQLRDAGKKRYVEQLKERLEASRRADPA
jgi:uncharacterized protein